MIGLTRVFETVSDKERRQAVHEEGLPLLQRAFLQENSYGISRSDVRWHSRSRASEKASSRSSRWSAHTICARWGSACLCGFGSPLYRSPLPLHLSCLT